MFAPGKKLKSHKPEIYGCHRVVKSGEDFEALKDFLFESLTPYFYGNPPQVTRPELGLTDANSLNQNHAVLPRDFLKRADVQRDARTRIPTLKMGIPLVAKTVWIRPSPQGVGLKVNLGRNHREFFERERTAFWHVLQRSLDNDAGRLTIPQNAATIRMFISPVHDVPLEHLDELQTAVTEQFTPLPLTLQPAVFPEPVT